MALAVKGADDVAVAVEQRSGHDRLQIGEAGRIAGGGLLGLLPEGALLHPNAGQNVLAGLPRLDRGPRSAQGGDKPLILLQQQHATGVQPHNLHQGLGRPGQKIGRADGGLEYAQGRLQPADEVVNQAGAQRRRRPKGARQVGAIGRTQGLLIEALDAKFVDGVGGGDEDAAAGQEQAERRGQLGAGIGRDRRPVAAQEGGQGCGC